jgi:flagellar hook-length control protein FliK
LKTGVQEAVQNKESAKQPNEQPQPDPVSATVWKHVPSAQMKHLHENNGFIFPLQSTGEQEESAAQSSAQTDAAEQPTTFIFQPGKESEHAHTEIHMKHTGDSEQVSKPASQLLEVNQRLELAQPSISNKTDMLSAPTGPQSTAPVIALAKEAAAVFQPMIQVKELDDKMEATFSLTPEHLGSVDVKVSLQDGRITAQFYADSAAGKHMLELHVDSLYTALQQQGLHVDAIDISQQSAPGFSSAFSQGGDSAPRQGQQDTRRRHEHARNQKEYADSLYDAEWVSQINMMA